MESNNSSISYQEAITDDYPKVLQLIIGPFID